VALQGEYSYRPNQPLQINGAELVLAVLGLPNLITGFTQIPGAPAARRRPRWCRRDTYIQGWRPKMSQFQMTGTKGWPNVIRREQLVLVARWARPSSTACPDLSSRGPACTCRHAVRRHARERRLDADRGLPHRVLLGLSPRRAPRYANALFGGTLAPRYSFAHDVNGREPDVQPGREGASAGLQLGLPAQVDRRYPVHDVLGGRTYCGTDVSGVPPTQSASFCSSANPLKDRDFWSSSVSYSF
jgi:hypothetical protein